MKRRIGGALLVQEANRREEIVREIESKRRVDFVDEDDQPLAPLGERHLPEIPGEPVAERGSGCAAHHFDDEVLSDSWSSRTVEKALVPLLGGRLRPELREIDDDGQGAFGRQSLRGADHQARLAHLARRQDVAEVAGAAMFEQLGIGAALEVHAAAGLHRAAGDERERVSSTHAVAR